MELTEPEIFACSIFVATEQIHDLPFADDVADFLSWTRSCSGRFPFGCFAIQAAGVHEIFDRLFETPPAGVQIYINTNARGAVTRQAQDLSLCRRVVRIKAGPHQHLFAVKRPAFDKHSVFVLAPDFVAQVICDGELEKMAGNTFVSKDWPRVLNCRANVKV